ncbi:MAG: 7-carboxy-7-deazaguanine synthase QueE [Sedimenticola sp.]
MSRLRITEIFYSLQGESNTVGLPTVFVRLTGCPLRCGYCDTAYAFKGGEWMGLEQILERVASYSPRWVTVTGGEPMAQKECPELLNALCDAGYSVSLETSGAVDLGSVDPRVIKVMDLKTPGSGEVEKNLYGNIEALDEKDQVKFVICDEADYLWSRQQFEALELDGRCEVLFSPALGQLDATELAEWIIRDRLQVRFQIQLHKYLWGDVAGK